MLVRERILTTVFQVFLNGFGARERICGARDRIWVVRERIFVLREQILVVREQILAICERIVVVREQILDAFWSFLSGLYWSVKRFRLFLNRL